MVAEKKNKGGKWFWRSERRENVRGTTRRMIKERAKIGYQQSGQTKGESIGRCGENPLNIPVIPALSGHGT